MPAIPNSCLRSLRAEPVPLYYEPQRLCVLWSAKAGCSFASKWFFFQAGLLDEAEAYSHWIHDYRARVFSAEDAYRDRLRGILEPGVRVLKFVRNPWDRVVSGYLAYCQALFEGSQRPHDKVINEISSVLGRSLNESSGFSFREFVRFLDERGVERCNIHFRRQASPCELEGMFSELTCVQIESAKDQLPTLEENLNLKPSPISALVRSGHHTVRVETDGFCGDDVFMKTVQIPVPATRSFFDESLESAVRTLYLEDFERYGYPPALLGHAD